MSDVVEQPTPLLPPGPVTTHRGDIEQTLRTACVVVEARCDDHHDRTLARVKEGLGLEADDKPPTPPHEPVLDIHEALLLRAAKLKLGLEPPPIDFGDYEIDARQGGGGMGVVHRAHDRSLDRTVALKLLRRRPGTHGPDLFAQAEAEARAMAQLSHPRVAGVYKVGRIADDAYIAMELVRGEPLTEWCTRHGSDQQLVLAMYVEIGHGLAEIHRAGVIHGDFKPDNVLVEPLTEDDRRAGLAVHLPHGKPKIIDFGMALHFGADIRGGTPEYMPPEQLGDAPQATFASDQYSFCVALFEDLLGCHPYAGQTYATFARTARASDPDLPEGQLRREYIARIGASVQRGEIHWPGQLSRLPRWLRDALARGLNCAPDRRFADMDALLALLDRPRLRALRWRRGRFYTIAAIAGAASVLAISAAIAEGPCDHLGDPTADLWNDTVRTGLGEDLSRQSLALFVPYAAAWQSTRREVCEANRMRGEISDAQHDARIRCLDDRLLHARTVRDAVARGDITPFEVDLAPPELCTLLDRPTDLVPPGKDRDRDRVAARLAGEGFAAELAADYTRGLAVTDQLRIEALAVGHRPLVAAVLYQSARLALQQHRTSPNDPALRARGEADLDAAIILAARAGDDALYTDAAVFHARFDAVAGRPATVAADAFWALDLPPERLTARMQADLTDVQAIIAFRRGLQAPAAERKPLFEAARAALERVILYYRDHGLAIQHAKALENLGAVHLELGDARAAADAYAAAAALADDLGLPQSYLATLYARSIHAAVERDDGTALALCEHAFARVLVPTPGAPLVTQAAEIDLSCAAALWSDPVNALPHARRAVAAPLGADEHAAAALIFASLILRLEAPPPDDLAQAEALLAGLNNVLPENRLLLAIYRVRLAILARNYSKAEFLFAPFREQFSRLGLPPEEVIPLHLDLAEARLATDRQGVHDALEQAIHILSQPRPDAPDDPSLQPLRARLADLQARAGQRLP